MKSRSPLRQKLSERLLPLVVEGLIWSYFQEHREEITEDKRRQAAGDLRLYIEGAAVKHGYSAGIQSRMVIRFNEVFNEVYDELLRRRTSSASAE